MSVCSAADTVCAVAYVCIGSGLCLYSQCHLQMEENFRYSLHRVIIGHTLFHHGKQKCFLKVNNLDLKVNLPRSSRNSLWLYVTKQSQKL